MKPELNIYVSAEASDEEQAAVMECFDEHFEVLLNKGELRFSDNLLPLVVTFVIGMTSNPVAVNIASSAVWDLLKIGINRLRNQPKSKIERETIIKILTHEKQLTITTDGIWAREKEEERTYHSIDEFFDDLRNG